MVIRQTLVTDIITNVYKTVLSCDWPGKINCFEYVQKINRVYFHDMHKPAVNPDPILLINFTPYKLIKEHHVH